MLKTLTNIFHLTLKISLSGQYYYSCFIDENVETQSLSGLPQQEAELKSEPNSCLCVSKVNVLNCYALQIHILVIIILENSLICGLSTIPLLWPIIH